jgi:hypothetical protein
MFTDYDDWDDQYDDEYVDESRYISKENAKSDNEYHRQEFSCPNCGSYNTGQSTYADFCNTSDWYFSY